MIYTKNQTLRINHITIKSADIGLFGFGLISRDIGSENGYQTKGRYTAIYYSPRKGFYVYNGQLNGSTRYTIRQYVYLYDYRTGVLYDKIDDLREDNSCFSL